MTDSFDSAFTGGAKGFSYSQTNQDGSPNYYFVPVGQPHGGIVTHIQTDVPVTEFTGPSKGQPKFWDEAKTRPMKQKVLTVDTRAGKYPCPPAAADDDGMRTFWVRDSSDLERAIHKALQKAPGLRLGSGLYAINTGTRPSKGGGTPARTFDAMHEPTAAPQDGFFGQSEASTQQPPTAPPGWGQQQAAAPAPAPQGPPAWQGSQAGIPQPAAQAPQGWGQPAPVAQAPAAPPAWNPQTEQPPAAPANPWS